MIRLKRDNVVKIVDSEFKAQQWERKGFKRLVEPEEATLRAGEVVNPAAKQESEEIKQLRDRAKELGIPRASQFGEEKLRKAVEEKEAEQREEEQKLTELKRVAADLGIEVSEGADIASLLEAIKAKEAEGGN